MAAERVVRSYTFLGVLFAVANIFFFLSVGHDVQASFLLSSIAFAAGIVVWVAIRVVFVKRELRTIEHYGVYPRPAGSSANTSRLLISSLAFVALLFGIVLLLFVGEYFPYWLFTLNFIFPFVPAFYATSAVYYWRWQRKNKRTLYAAEGKVYPYPYMNMSLSKETIY